MKEIIVLGNYTESEHEATRVVAVGGVSPTIKHNHGSVVAVLVKDERNNSNRRYAK